MGPPRGINRARVGACHRPRRLTVRWFTERRFSSLTFLIAPAIGATLASRGSGRETKALALGYPLESTPAKAGAGMSGVLCALGGVSLELRHDPVVRRQGLGAGCTPSVHLRTSRLFGAYRRSILPVLRRQVDSHRLYYCCLEEGVVRVARRGAHHPEDPTPELFPPSLPTSGKPDVGGEGSASSACPVVHQALQYSFRDEEGERSCRFQAASGRRTAR